MFHSSFKGVWSSFSLLSREFSILLNFLTTISTFDATFRHKLFYTNLSFVYLKISHRFSLCFQFHRWLSQLADVGDYDKTIDPFYVINLTSRIKTSTRYSIYPIRCSLISVIKTFLLFATYFFLSLFHRRKISSRTTNVVVFQNNIAAVNAYYDWSLDLIIIGRRLFVPYTWKSSTKVNTSV